MTSGRAAYLRWQAESIIRRCGGDAQKAGEVIRANIDTRAGIAWTVDDLVEAMPTARRRMTDRSIEPAWTWLDVSRDW